MLKRIGLTLGFTLIEMGIVLVVVGLLLSGGIVAVAPVIAGTKASETNQKLDRIEQALNLYVIRYGCLPCPADGTLGTTAGLAVGNANTYTSRCLSDSPTSSATCGITNGDAVVPWGALGLPQSDATDGWGSLISYAVDGTLALNSTSMKRTGSEYPDGGLSVSDATPGVPVAITTTAAYVLISHGADGSNARTTSGAARGNPNAGNTVQNNNAAANLCSAAPCHQDQTYEPFGANKFDDIVRWRTAPLIIQFCGTNACGNPT